MSAFETSTGLKKTWSISKQLELVQIQIVPKDKLKNNMYI